MYMVGPDETIVRDPEERMRRKPGRYLKPPKPSLGEIIFRVLEEEKLKEDELKHRAKEMAIGESFYTEGSFEFFYKSTLDAWLEHGYVKHDETSGTYSLNYEHPFFRNLKPVD